MRIIEIEFNEDIRWRIDQSDPCLLNLQSLPGWAFINPLVYPSILSQMVLPAHYHLGLVVNGALLIETNALCFQLTSPHLSDQEIYRNSDEFAPQFLAHLGYQSKQAKISHAIYGGAALSLNLADVPDVIFPLLRAGESSHVINIDCVTAVQWIHVEHADKGIVAGDPPLYAGVLLDAAEAYLARDDRRTVLYAAMAVEMIARAKVGLPPKRNKGSNFQQLLGDLPLKTLGRSLEVEKPILYAQAEHLYRTRNGLVHEGKWPSDSTALPEGFAGEGAFRALECAQEVFHWFGEPGEYCPPTPGVIVRAGPRRLPA